MTDEFDCATGKEVKRVIANHVVSLVSLNDVDAVESMMLNVDTLSDIRSDNGDSPTVVAV